MKGYRTIAFSIAVILLGLIGKHLQPDLINEYLDVVFAGIGLGFLVLRLVTNTPFGAMIAADLGTSPAAIQNLVATLDPDLTNSIGSAVDDLNAATARLSGHPLFEPATVSALNALASSLPTKATPPTADPPPAAAPAALPAADTSPAVTQVQ